MCCGKMKKSGLYVLLTVLLAFGDLAAQEVSFPDYNSMRDSIGIRLEQWEQAHGCPDMNTVRANTRRDMRPDNRVTVASLPVPRKKALTGPRLYDLCKQSSLVVCQYQRHPQGQPFRWSVMASAVALTADGVCATNYHVFYDVVLTGMLCSTVPNPMVNFVMTADGRFFPLESILAADPVNDFIIFKVDTGGDSLVPMPLGNQPDEGETVYSLAHPQGYLFYLTQGIVSRNHTITNRMTGVKKLETQVTAEYAVGASGGPMIDRFGNLAGLVSSTSTIYPNPQVPQNQQMLIKSTVPLRLIKECLIVEKKGGKR